MIVDAKDKEKLVKTHKLLNENEKLDLYSPYVVERGETMDTPITIEHSVDEIPYYLTPLGAVYDSVRCNPEVIQEEVMKDKKILVLLHLSIPYRNDRDEKQFPSEMLVEGADDFFDGLDMPTARRVNVSTEFLQMDPMEIIGVKFSELKIKDMDSTGKFATSFEFKYDLQYTDGKVISDCHYGNI